MALLINSLIFCDVHRNNWDAIPNTVYRQHLELRPNESAL